MSNCFFMFYVFSSSYVAIISLSNDLSASVLSMGHVGGGGGLKSEIMSECVGNIFY